MTIKRRRRHTDGKKWNAKSDKLSTFFSGVTQFGDSFMKKQNRFTMFQSKLLGIKFSLKVRKKQVDWKSLHNCLSTWLLALK
jgi:hypothetical protein